MLGRVYQRLPGAVQPIARRIYHRVHPFRPSLGEIENAFVDTFFDSWAEYRRYAREFRETEATRLLADAQAEHRRMTDVGRFGSVGPETGERYYALVRKYRPEVMVETGVCNGFSTLCLLYALDRNDEGVLYSVDYPFYESDALDEFRAETYDEFGGATIPDGRTPGWMIPDQLRDRWDLRVGRSQRELPPLVTELKKIDLFLHDSEHSLPCMLFEFELAWEWLDHDGILVVDDFDWNEALEAFSDARKAKSGLVSPSVGYLRKQ